MLFTRPGIAEEIKSKLRPLKGPAAPYVAKGDPEIALTQISTIISFEGVEFAGPLPPDVPLLHGTIELASPALMPAFFPMRVVCLLAEQSGHSNQVANVCVWSKSGN